MSMPVECIQSYAVRMCSVDGGSGGPVRRSSGRGTSRVPARSASITASPSVHTVPVVPAMRAASSGGPQSPALDWMIPEAPDRSAKRML